MSKFERFLLALIVAVFGGFAVAVYAASPTGKQWQSTQNTSFQVRDVQFTWEHPTEREDGATLSLDEISHYVIEVSKDNNSRSFAVAKSLSYTMKKLRTGTYQFRIATVDADGLQGRFSTPVTLII